MVGCCFSGKQHRGRQPKEAGTTEMADEEGNHAEVHLRPYFLPFTHQVKCSVAQNEMRHSKTVVNDGKFEIPDGWRNPCGFPAVGSSAAV